MGDCKWVVLVRTWGIQRWERCGPECIRPRLRSQIQLRRVGGRNRDSVYTALSGAPTVPRMLTAPASLPTPEHNDGFIHPHLHPRKMPVSSSRAGSLSFQCSGHPAPCLHVVAPSKCLLSGWGDWLEQSQRQRSPIRLDGCRWSGRSAGVWRSWGSGEQQGRSQLWSGVMKSCLGEAPSRAGLAKQLGPAHTVCTIICAQSREYVTKFNQLEPPARKVWFSICWTRNMCPERRSKVMGEPRSGGDRGQLCDSGVCLFFHPWYRGWSHYIVKDTLPGWGSELQNWTWGPGAR